MYYSITGTNVRILGVMHAFPVAHPIMPAWVMAAEHWAEALVIEGEPGSIQQHFKSPGLGALQSEVPRDLWDQLVKFWPETGPAAPLQELNLWAAAIMATQLHIQSVPGVDGFLQMCAAKSGKRIAPLETAEDLARRFRTISRDDVIAMLREALADLSAHQRYFDALYLSWRSGDVDEVLRCAMLSPGFSNPRVREALVVGRNQGWADQIDGILTTPNKTLIAVGALHLAGPGNLLECLGRSFEKLPSESGVA